MPEDDVADDQGDFVVDTTPPGDHLFFSTLRAIANDPLYQFGKNVRMTTFVLTSVK